MNNIIRKLKQNPKSSVIGGAILLAVIVLVIIKLNATEEVAATEERLPAVRVARVAELSGSSDLSLIGTVASVNEVKLESEASGRVTRVFVGLGDTVRAGQTIATIENAAENAALLQAQGSYEAALAAAARSDIGVNDAGASLTAAKQGAISANRAALSSWTSVLFNTVDELFSNPRAETPGVRISANGNSFTLNRERVAMTTQLNDWQKSSESLSENMASTNLLATLDSAILRNARLSAMLDIFIELLARQNTDDVFTVAELSRLQSAFASAKTTLNGNRSSLETAKTNLIRAEESLSSAQVGGTGTAVSSANAAVKQALGSLRAAEANYAKTIIRTPIGGTVNTLSIRAGDYVTQRTPVSNIANNNAIEITSYIGVNDRDRVSIGSSVLVDGKYTGTVSAIAPGIDPTTKKVEVKIQTETDKLASGDTVSLSISGDQIATEVNVDTPIVVPVSALKVETDRIVVFTVNADGVLEAHKVEEGPLQGTHIMIMSGITADMEIVTDARGLNAGDKVEVLN